MILDSVAILLTVPQGSILRLLLFLLYQNNLSNSSNHSKIATFADDTKIYNKINHTYKLQDSSSTLTWSKQVLHQCAQANLYSTVHNQNQDHLCSLDAISYTRLFPPRICIQSLDSTVC